jgi:Ribonuclease G/E
MRFLHHLVTCQIVAFLFEVNRVHTTEEAMEINDQLHCRRVEWLAILERIDMKLRRNFRLVDRHFHAELTIDE